MIKLIQGVIALCLLAMSLHTQAVSAKQTEFNTKVFQQLKQQYQGQKWLMVLWSVDCPACFKELALLKKIATKRSNKGEKTAVVLINVDDSEEVILERLKVLSQYQLTDFQHLFFANGKAAQSRYLIDPSWYGELPRSYFIDEKGVFHGKSGLLDERLLTTWLN